LTLEIAGGSYEAPTSQFAPLGCKCLAVVGVVVEVAAEEITTPSQITQP